MAQALIVGGVMLAGYGGLVLLLVRLLHQSTRLLRDTEALVRSLAATTHVVLPSQVDDPTLPRGQLLHWEHFGVQPSLPDSSEIGKENI